MRCTLNKEYTKISSTTNSDIKERLTEAKEDFDSFDKTASSTEMLVDAKKAIGVAQEYLNKGDLENAIISLQLHDRILADLKIILLP